MGRNQKTVPSLDEAVDKQFIEESVEFINEKANETLYRGSLEIGEFLLKHFFNDDIELASSRNPRKPKSYKALCNHKELAVPYTTLTIMVRVAAQERFFKANNINTNKLSYTHKADLIRLNNDDVKLELTHKCIANKLSTRQLSQLVNKKRRQILEDKKSDQDETAFKNILRIDQLINRSLKSDIITDIDRLRSMRSKTRDELRQKTSDLLKQMTQKTKECKALLRNLDKIDPKK